MVLPFVTGVAQDVSAVHQFEASVAVLDDIDACPAFGQMMLLGVNLEESALELAAQLRAQLALVV